LPRSLLPAHMLQARACHITHMGETVTGAKVLTGACVKAEGTRQKAEVWNELTLANH